MVIIWWFWVSYRSRVGIYLNYLTHHNRYHWLQSAWYNHLQLNWSLILFFNILSRLYLLNIFEKFRFDTKAHFKTLPESGPFPTTVEEILLNLEISATNGATRLNSGINIQSIVNLSSKNELLFDASFVLTCQAVYPLLETGRTDEGIPLSSKEIIPLPSNNKTNSWYFPSPPGGISRRIRCWFWSWNK